MVPLDIYTEVLRCTACPTLVVRRDAFEDVPQPGFVGARYAASRVLVVGQNPGQPTPALDQQDRVYTTLLRGLRDDPSQESLQTYQRYAIQFAAEFPILRKYPVISACGLDLDDIAYCNLVRCRSRERGHTVAVARTCAMRHFARWLDALEPRFVVFIGKWPWEQGQGELGKRRIPSAFINCRQGLSKSEIQADVDRVGRLVKASSPAR